MNSALMRSVAFHLLIPTSALLAMGNPYMTSAYASLSLVGLGILRTAQKGMRHKFNAYAEGLSLKDKSQIRPILNALNNRPEAELSLNNNDFNPLQRPFAATFGLASGVAGQDPFLGLAIYVQAMSIAEMVHLLKIKFQSAKIYIESNFSSPK